jgi:hypothetical protein
VLLLLDHAGVQALLQAGRDLLLGHAAVAVAADAEQAQHAFGGHRQQRDERPRRGGQPVHRRGHQARDRLRKHLAQALGYQLAEDDGQEGDHQHHQRGGGDVRRACADREVAADPARERPGEGRIADDAVQDPDRGDADLHRRQELGRPLVEVDRRLRAGFAGFQHDLQPRLAAGGERHLGHGEHAVEEDQEDEERDVHAQGR